MTKNYETEQENFWCGQFGDEYVERNRSGALLGAKTAFFARVLARSSGIRTVLELGANIGLNEIALQRLLPELQMLPGT